ncbi:hypothetical protein J2Y55_004808 [Bosea sp. BE125]|uniref:hypothetical protein n=1 Tax=Bosea sp. BE125 TaxID=2817909 RepID=UPI0028602EA9|nr:hypothetical protein [Bosea sp. BE125]MDR6873779.1 hypothetical protein [Bosea sp. BE125]
MLVFDRANGDRAIGIAMADCAGGFVAAALIVSIMLLADTVYRHLPFQTWRRSAAATLTVVVFGLAINVSTYVLVEALYRPTPVRFDAVVSNPADGMFVTAKPTERRPQSEFRMIPGEASQASINWLHPKGNLRSEWKSQRAGAFSASVEFYDGCTAEEAVAYKGRNTEGFSLGRVSKVNLAFGEGYSNLTVPSLSTSFGRAELKADTPILFYLSGGDDSAASTRRVTQFVGAETKLNISRKVADHAYYLSAILIDGSEDRPKLSGQRLRLSVDDKPLDIDIAAPTRTTETKRSACRPIPIRQLMRSEKRVLRNPPLDPGVLLRLTRNLVSGDATIGDDISLSVDGDGGWIRLSYGDDKSSRIGRDGKLEVIQLRGNFVRFEVDGVAQTPNPIDSYALIGDIDGSFPGGNQVRFVGTASAFWKDQVRQNPTRWERLALELKIAILGALLSLLTIVSRAVLKEIWDDRDLLMLRPPP